MIRFFDILFSSIAIIVLTPFMIPIMIGLKLTGEHDIFYKQMRVGKGGKEFGLLKFATMLRNSPNMPGGLLTQENDPRILPMGRFLRKTKINELPQLINILKGEMSVIGYRPQVRQQYMYFPEKYRKIMEKDVPGLSGMGAIVFRSEEELLLKVPNKEEFYERVVMCKQVRDDHKALYIHEKGKSCPTEILEKLEECNMEGRPIWKPMHAQPIYRTNKFVTANGNGRGQSNAYIDLGKARDVGMDIFSRGLCLPSDIKMTKEEQDMVIATIRECFE